jgi:Mrp family chromosome partitioning ATPase
MTALDQAFIRAFARQDTVPLAVSVRPAVPEDEQRATKNEERGLGGSPPGQAGRGQRAVGSAEDSGLRVRSSDTAESKVGESRIQNPKSKIQNTRSPISDLQSPIPNPSLSQGVWAALEEPPKGVASPLKTRSLFQDIVQSFSAVQNDPRQPRAAAVPQVGIETGSKIDEERAAKNEELPESREPKAEDHEDQEERETRNEELPVPPSVSNPQPLTPDPLVPPSPVPAPFPFTVPLSAPREFNPAWQVDHFTWPRLCRRLIARAAEELDRLADALLTASTQGQKVLAIAGCHRGEGATTLLLCAARRLAERGVKLVLVDADLSRPRLAKRLGVQPQFGWDETTEEEGRWLDQAIVEATANNLALLPAREPAEECGRNAGDPSRLPACLKTLRDHYDMVLVDLGPLEGAGSADDARRKQAAGMVDAVVLVYNPRITSEQQQRAFEEQLAADGIAVAGIVENFVAEE